MEHVLPWVSVGISILSLLGVALTRFNDLSHLEKSVEEIKGNIKSFFERLDKDENRITAQETKCEERHK